MKRTHYLDEEQDARLAKLAAAETGIRKSALIRDAINAFLQGPGDDAIHLARFRAALKEIEQHSLPLPDGRTYVR